MFLTATPWQPALAEHSLSVGARACHIARDQQVACTSNSTFSAAGPVGMQVTDTGGQASVSLDYGVFKGSADVAVQGGEAALVRPFDVDSTARASAADSWLITGGSGVGYLQFTWSVDGVTSSVSHSTSSPGGAGIYDDAYLLMEGHFRAQTFGTDILGSELTTGYLHGSATDAMPGRAAFYFDRPIDVVFTGSVVALLGANDQFRGPYFSGAAHADFSHTAVLTAIQVYDSSGTLLRDVVITAESGTLYPLAAVPEPASAALLLLGIGALASRRRLRWAW